MNRNLQVQLESAAVIPSLQLSVQILLSDWIQQEEERAKERALRYRPGVPTTLFAIGRGQMEVSIMLEYDEQYCKSTTRLRQATLKKLIARLQEPAYGIQDTRYMTAAEKIIIFLDYCAHKKSYRELRRVYQHSFLTFSRIIKQVSVALCQLFKATVTGLPDINKVPSEIQDNEKYSYFTGCLGAIDGTHVVVRLSDVDPAPWRNRHGDYTQNVLIACDFDLRILFVQPGYEGSANDGNVLKKAIEHGFGDIAPTTHYYLADGGYSKKLRMLLVPYQKTRYHLREIQDARKRPETMQELFNLRHSHLRNCIERVNGILKARWKILRDGPEKGFSIKQQMALVWALSAVHNFCIQEGQTVADDEEDLNIQTDVQDEEDDSVDEGPATSHQLDNSTMVRFRDQLAQRMWDDFNA